MKEDKYVYSRVLIMTHLSPSAGYSVGVGGVVCLPFCVSQRCDGCKDPACDAARKLVAHMRGCNAGAACNPKCVQAQKMLLHYAECK